MPIDPNFLKMLVCPQSREPLREASGPELETVNRRIQAGTATNRGGESVGDALVEGLVPTSGGAVYPVRDGIPILLPHEALPLGGDASDSDASDSDAAAPAGSADD